ncbi:hypothetical protein J6590_051680 [Homalodisca vitripennis]|nr:hypothetical protein J6590_051680 [Homalodisca vitripennis]
MAANFRKLHNIALKDDKRCFSWLQHVGLVPKNPLREICGKEITVTGANMGCIIIELSVAYIEMKLLANFPGYGSFSFRDIHSQKKAPLVTNTCMLHKNELLHRKYSTYENIFDTKLNTCPAPDLIHALHIVTDEAMLLAERTTHKVSGPHTFPRGPQSIQQLTPVCVSAEAGMRGNVPGSSFSEAHSRDMNGFLIGRIKRAGRSSPLQRCVSGKLCSDNKIRTEDGTINKQVYKLSQYLCEARGPLGPQPPGAKQLPTTMSPPHTYREICSHIVFALTDLGRLISHTWHCWRPSIRYYAVDHHEDKLIVDLRAVAAAEGHTSGTVATYCVATSASSS